jgi:hypothetical protein
MKSLRNIIRGGSGGGEPHAGVDNDDKTGILSPDNIFHETDTDRATQQHQQQLSEPLFYPEDGSLVGTREILQSPRVSWPGKNNDDSNNTNNDKMGPPTPVIPVPSVYSDARGSIHNLLIHDRHRINILHTHKGVMRSGDIHEGMYVCTPYAVPVCTAVTRSFIVCVPMGPHEPTHCSCCSLNISLLSPSSSSSCSRATRLFVSRTCASVDVAA